MDQPRDRFPVSDARELRVDIGSGVSLRTLLRGDLSCEPVVLLVHGLASNARMWDGVGSALAARGIASISVDLRGHGLSSKPDDGYDFQTVTSDLVAVLEGLGVSRAVIVGQSWGGNIAVHALRHHPEAFTSGVAVDGGFIELKKTFPKWNDCARQLQPPRLAGMRAGRLESAIRSTNSDWPETGIIGSLSNFEYLNDGTIRPWLTFDRHMAILRALWDHRPSEMFPHIHQPLLFLPADSGDVAWTRNKERSVESAIAALRQGRVHWFRPAHHDLHAQHPERTADVLIGHIDEGFLV